MQKPLRCIDRAPRTLLSLLTVMLLVLTSATASAEDAAAGQKAIADKAKELRSVLERVNAESGLKEARDALIACGLLKLEKSRILLQRYMESDYRDQIIVEELDQGVKTLRRALAQKRNPLLSRKGLVEHAYVASNDNSPQPYLVYVPENYDGTRPFGLFVFLHGYAYDLNKYNWIGMMFPEPEAELISRNANCLFVMPYARGNTDFQAVGEDDVMLVIRRTIRDYNVDPDRVILSGISMGGMGAWTIAAHYPDRFAAVVPISARGDYFLWHVDVQEDELPPFKRKQIGMEFGADLLPNLQLPSLIICGSRDMLIRPEQSRLMARKLKETGYSTRLLEIQDADHYSWSRFLDNPPILEIARTARRKRLPRKVAYRTWTLKFNDAWWVSIMGIDNWWRPADITAEADPEAGKVTVQSSNVTRVRLELPRELQGGHEDLKVDWNGKVSRHKAGRDTLVIELSHGFPEDAAVVKTPEFSGPIREAFAGPFAIVHGAPKGAEELPEPALRAASMWLQYAQGMPLVVSHEQVGKDLIRDRNLILVGNPGTNPLIARINDRLAVRFAGTKEGGWQYVIGEHRYSGADLGMVMVYPNPLNAKRLVVVMSGVPWGSAIAPNHVFDMLPDYIVFNAEKALDGTDSQETLCAGYFNTKWELDRRTLWVREKERGEWR